VAPVIDIIVPSYNDKQFLAMLVESLYSNIVGNPFSLTIVDDHSTDGTPDWVMANLRDYATYIRPERKSYFTRAVNFGIEYSRANHRPDYLFVLNSDITFTPYWGAGMVATFLQHKAGVVGATLHNPNATIQYVGAYGAGFHMDINKVQTRFFDGYAPAWVTGAAMMIRPDVIEDVGLFPILKGPAVQYDASDREFCKNVVMGGYEIRVSPAVLYHHTHVAEAARTAAGDYLNPEMRRIDR
jgi:GT2 family glycosyltransferase